jgi:hypothetical protein
VELGSIRVGILRRMFGCIEYSSIGVADIAVKTSEELLLL